MSNLQRSEGSRAIDSSTQPVSMTRNGSINEESQTLRTVGSLKITNDRMNESRNKLKNIQPFKTELRGI